MFGRFRRIPIRSALATIPLGFYITDSFYSIVRVRGSVMEPTLYDGDVLLVRKSDNPWWQQLTKYVKHNLEQYYYYLGEKKDWSNHDRHLDEEDPEPAERILERRTLKDYERQHCATAPSLQIKPPLALSGDIVVYKNPKYYYCQAELNARLNVKRVIGLGGQVVMVPSSRYDDKKGRTLRTDDKRKRNGKISSGSGGSMRIATTCVAPYSIWVEGDNPSNSYDNKQHGSITKHLLVGVAERIVWPPTRWQILSNEVDSNIPMEERPQAYWP